MQSPEKPFNDFFLLGLSHLLGFEVSLGVRIALQEKQRRLRYGKKAIRKHTAKGDLIAFETPEEYRLEHFKKVYEAITGKKITPEIEKKLLMQWPSISKAAFNTYFELAQYAKSIGRRVISLELSIRKPASAFELAYWREPEGMERKKRMEYLFKERANISFLRRIQSLKPRMVIVSWPHAAFIEGKAKPTKVDYFPKIEERQRQLTFKEALAATRLYKRKKMARLRMRREAKRKPI